MQQTYAEHGLSFTDAMSVAMVESHDVDGVVSVDGVVARLSPDTLSPQ